MRFTPTNIGDWHRWFAWRPVDVDGSWVWLEFVERKRCYEDRPPYDFSWWAYRNCPAGGTNEH